MIVVPCALVLAVLGPGLAETFLAYGSTSVADARYLGEVFAVFCLGLLPYMFFQLQLRVFYALHDSRTPALIGLLTMVVNIVTNVVALAILPPGQVVAGLGVGFGLANLAGTVVAWQILSRRIGGLDGRAVAGSPSGCTWRPFPRPVRHRRLADGGSRVGPGTSTRSSQWSSRASGHCCSM